MIITAGRLDQFDCEPFTFNSSSFSFFSFLFFLFAKFFASVSEVVLYMFIKV